MLCQPSSAKFGVPVNRKFFKIRLAILLGRYLCLIFKFGLKTKLYTAKAIQLLINQNYLLGVSPLLSSLIPYTLIM